MFEDTESRLVFSFFFCVAVENVIFKTNGISGVVCVCVCVCTLAPTCSRQKVTLSLSSARQPESAARWCRAGRSRAAYMLGRCSACHGGTTPLRSIASDSQYAVTQRLASRRAWIEYALIKNPTTCINTRPQRATKLDWSYDQIMLLAL